MPHDTPLVSTIVAGFVLAFIFGSIANRLRLPPLVGYLLAGVLVGPFTPGFVANADLATELSEIGVILLMFGVGLHFSLKDLLSVQALAIPGALGRIALGTLMGVGLALMLGWSLFAGVVFGLALSVASTVVLLTALQDRHMVDSERGRVAVGWVIVEDIAMVLALVLIPAFAGLFGGTAAAVHDPFIDFIERVAGVQLNLYGIVGVTIVKLAAFVGFMFVVGRRVIPFILHFTAHSGSRELFRLAVLAIALGVAAGAAYLFGVSLALGAFFAGMILSESELSHRAAQESLPLRDAFAVLFFVSVGMLFDPTIIIRSPIPVLATLFIILFGKSIVAFLIVVAFRRPASTALTIAASLAQIGEFSFILAALGVSLGVLPPEGRDLILAGAMVSIIVNPALFWLADVLKPVLDGRARAHEAAAAVPERSEPELVAQWAVPDESRPAPAAAAEAHPKEDESEVHATQKSGHIVLVGYGRVGSVVAEGLLASNSPFVLIEDAESRIAAAKALNIEVIVGNAASPKVLALANVAAATTALIAIPNAFEAGQATEQCRALNPALKIIARAHSEEEIEYLSHLGADQVIMGEREIGLGMLGWINGENEHAGALAQSAARLAAVANALKIEPHPAKPLPPAPRIVTPPPVSDPAVIVGMEAAIEAAHPQHETTGPAEPPSEVPALGEMPDQLPAEVTETVTPHPAAGEPSADIAAAPAEALAAKPPRARASRPATTAATPFNPEVPPEPAEVEPSS